jgi:carbon-monoxide dehydrogenase large subunit
MNAVVDALDHAGLGRAAERIDMPATPERIWQLLREAPARS